MWGQLIPALYVLAGIAGVAFIAHWLWNSLTGL